MGRLAEDQIPKPLWFVEAEYAILVAQYEQLLIFGGVYVISSGSVVTVEQDAVVRVIP